MLAFLGHWLVLLALGSAVLNIGATTIAYRRPNRAAWLEVGHNAALVMWAFIAAASALLIAAFLNNDFSLAIVWETSSLTQPLAYKISAMWGGQAGSLLLWTLILASYTLAVSVGGRRSGQVLSPAATSTMCAVTLFFGLLIAFVADPFRLVEGAVPQDGRGMTPLLQNYWMQIHPPTLYMGFVGCAVPFAFAVSALLHRRFDEEWVAVIRRWVLFTWIWLTVGIILGGVWAYETLGWGGYWAWDPVENASLIPWLSATAFLHSIMLQGRRGLLKNWNISLVTLTFLLSIFGTYLNRSGVVSSVHAFAQDNRIGAYFLTFLGVTLLAMLVLIFWRRSELYSDAKIESPWSREGVFMLNNWLLLGATFAVIWGTVFPTLSEAFGGSRVAVEATYFNRVMVRVGPLLPWRRATPVTVWKAIKFPLLWSLAFSPVLYLLAQWRTGAATSFVLSCFVALSIGWEFVRGIRTLMVKRRESAFESAANLVSFNPARYGGYIVHLGIALMFVGITGSSVFKIELDPITLKPGETMRLGEYTLRFEGLARPKPMPAHLTDQVVALVSVFDGPVGTNPVTTPDRPLDPRMDYFKDVTKAQRDPKEQLEPVRRPCILSSPANDIYLTLDAFDTKDNSAAIKAYLNPLVMWIWVSVGFFIGGTLIALLPTRKSTGLASSSETAPSTPSRETSRVSEQNAEKEAERELVA
jgi:cytochrome c-type biogenesis protein CcmF